MVKRLVMCFFLSIGDPDFHIVKTPKGLEKSEDFWYREKILMMKQKLKNYSDFLFFYQSAYIFIKVIQRQKPNTMGMNL